MTQDCLDDHIRVIQCDFALLCAGLADALSVGSRKILCLNRKNVSTSYILNLLRCYKAFTSEVTFATKVEFNRLEEGPATIVLTLDSNIFPYVAGTGSSTDIAIHFEDLINDTITIPPYIVVRVKNILYIYSYDITASFNDTVLASVSNPELASATITNLQNNTDEILDLWNNITHEQLCKIIKFAGVQANFDKLVTSNSCNC
jgi:hypothetical protein